jgi:GT2 family glycosyltransferase/glycosyltransferase involved in cell wall biosynthesis
VTSIDVVVPVSGSASSVRACLDSVLAAPQKTAFDLIVVDDASPEPELGTMLSAMAGSGLITLLTQQSPQGFAAAINRAAALHPDRDIVVIHEDAELANDWLDRLSARATDSADVCTITPFASWAGLAGYPRMGTRNAVPQGHTAASLDLLFRRANAGRSAVVPFSYGPCVYFRRRCLDSVGPFEDGGPGGGLGVEQGFSLRSARAGFHHLLAGDVYVRYRSGGAAADREPALRTASASGKLFPPYPAQRAELLAGDPARPFRRAVDLLRLRESSRHLVCFVAHAWGGGIRRHITDLASLVGGQCEVLLLEPAGGDTVKLSWLKDGEDFSAYFILPADMEALVSLLRVLGVARLHFHHVQGLPRSVLDLPGSLDVPYDCTLHDYYPICPQYHLNTAKGAYCGEPDARGCASCLAQRPGQWGLDIGAWRAAFGKLLRGAGRVFAPSRDVARRVERYFPGLETTIIPHPEGATRPLQRVVRVAILGNLTPEKGLHAVVSCAADARSRGLPHVFRVLGSTSQPAPQWPDTPLSIHGQYSEHELVALIEAERPDVFWFPAQVPETYSYTLSVAMASGIPIVASALGAFPERLEGYARSTLLPWNASAAQWNEALLAAGGAMVNSGALAEDLPRRSKNARYGALYLAPLASAGLRRQPGASPALDLHHFYLPPGQSELAPLSLPELFASGVECGHRGARLELKRRLDVANAQLMDFNAVLEQAKSDYAQLAAQLVETQRGERAQVQVHLRNLETALSAARARIDELEASRIWRATAPLRRGVHSLKLLAAKLRGQWASLRGSRRHIGYALTILRDEGTRSLARRVWRRVRRPHRYATTSRKVFASEAAIQSLTFPEAEAPAVTIIIPVHGKPLLTYTCLKSVHGNTPAGSYEVIVVDDASPDPAEVALKEMNGVRFVRNEANLGFVGSCNRAAQLARGDVLVFLNNDTIVTPGWLESLIAVLRERPAAGLVGAKLIYPDGRLQEAGGLVWRDGSAWNYGKGDDPDRPEYNYVREVDYCSGACLAIERKLFEQIGAFDVRFAPAYYEDTDLAFAVRAAGRKVYYQPSATVVHFEGGTAGTDLASGAKRYQDVNQGKFLRKWEASLARHGPNGLAPEFERDRWPKHRVLVIDACMLTPDRDAGSLRMREAIDLLVGLGCKVTFVADNIEHRQPYVRQLQQAGVEVQFHPYVRSVIDFLGKRGTDFDLVLISRHYVAAKYLDIVRQLAPHALIVFDTVDLHFLREERMAELNGSVAARIAVRATREKELALIREADVTLVVSHIEKELLERLEPQARVMILSTIHEAREGGKPFEERSGLVFIGGFRHPPNTDAIIWYATEILPLVRQRLPGVKTYVVGGDVPLTLKGLAADDLVFTGYVPDITPYLTGCRLSISPLRYGAGVKGKVNHAMSYSLPVVATSPSIEGMHLTAGCDVLVGDSPEAFADAVARAYQDRQLWHALARAGLENIRAHFSRACALRALTHLLALTSDHRVGKTAALQSA